MGLALLAVMLGFEAAAAPKLLIVGLIGLSIAVYTFFHLTGGLVLLTLVSFFELLPTAVGGNLSVVKVVGAILTLAWLWRVIDRQSGVRILIWDHPWVTASIVALAFWGLTSVVWARNSGGTVYYGSRLVQVVLLVFVVYSAVSTVQHLRWVLWAFTTGAFLTTALGMQQGLRAGGTGRLTGGLAEPNFLAAVIAAAIVLSLVLLLTSRGYLRLIPLGYLVVLVPGLFMTGSRGGMVTFGATIVIALALGGPARPQLAGLVLVLTASAIAYYAIVAPATARQRVTAISAQDSAGRVDQYQVALKVFHDSPLIGVGLGNFVDVQPDYLTITTSFYDVRALVENAPVHNIYLSTAAELGLVGVLLLVAAFGCCLYAGVTGFRQRSLAGDREGELLGRGVVTAALSFLVAYSFLPGFYDKQLWLMLGLCTAMLGIRGSEERAG